MTSEVPRVGFVGTVVSTVQAAGVNVWWLESLENCMNSDYAAWMEYRLYVKKGMTDKGRKGWLGHTECQM